MTLQLTHHTYNWTLGNEVTMGTFNMMPTHLYKHSPCPPIFFRFSVLFSEWLIQPWGKERLFWLMNLEEATVSREKWQHTKHNAQRLKRRKRRTTRQAESAKKTVSCFFLLETWAHLIPSFLFSLWILPSVSFSQSWLSVDFFHHWLWQ